MDVCLTCLQQIDEWKTSVLSYRNAHKVKYEQDDKITRRDRIICVKIISKETLI